MQIRRIHATRCAVLSDFHIAPSGAPLAGHAAPAALLRAVCGLRRMGYEVIINGDLFDLERGALPYAGARVLRQIMSEYGDVVGELQQAGAWLTVGNHDDELRSVGACDGLDVVMGAHVVRVEHGHRFDAPIKRQRWFASAATWASGRAVAAGGTGLYRLMRAAESLTTGRKTTGHPERDRAAAWLQSSNYDGLVIGHVHRAYAGRHNGKLLLCPGDGLREPFGVVLLSVEPRQGDEHSEALQATLAAWRDEQLVTQTTVALY